MVPAYPNGSAFLSDFPAALLMDLVTTWYNAVAGGNAAPDAFHPLVSGCNSPKLPGQYRVL